MTASAQCGGRSTRSELRLLGWCSRLGQTRVYRHVHCDVFLRIQELALRPIRWGAPLARPRATRRTEGLASDEHVAVYDQMLRLLEEMEFDFEPQRLQFGDQSAAEDPIRENSIGQGIAVNLRLA